MQGRRALWWAVAALALAAGVAGAELDGRVLVHHGVVAGAPPAPLAPAVAAYPAGTTRACVERQPVDIAPGASYDATVTRNGDVLDAAGTTDARFPGGAGLRYCVHDPQGLAAGRYEILVESDGAPVMYDALWVGDDHEVVVVSFVNTSNRDVCTLRVVPAGARAFGPNDIRAPLVPGRRVALDVATGRHAIQAVACDGTVVHEHAAVELRAGDRVAIAR